MSRVSRAAAACVVAATLTVAAPAAATPDVEPVKIERLARSVIGTPYSYGGGTPAGFDCSGFTSWVYSHVGVTLPHSSSAQYGLAGSDGFTRIESIEDLQVGDLVFHATGGSGVGHVGIYVGDGMFISATSSEGIQERSLSDSYWGPLWVGGVRVGSVRSAEPSRLKKREVPLDLVRADVSLVLVPLGTLIAK